MKTIHKYKIEGFFGSRQAILMPAGAKVIAADLQDSDICVWAEVDKQAADINYTHKHQYFWVIGTGQPLPKTTSDIIHIATIVWHSLVYHIYKESI